MNTLYFQNRRAILEKIKENGGFWSYDGIPENINNDDLIEEALLHLDFEDFHLMFENWSESHIRRIWKKRLLSQGKRLTTLNLLLEILFFNNKQDGLHGAKTEILGDDQSLMFINDGSVKLSFFSPENPVKNFNQGYTMNNLKTPTLQELLGMKLYTLCVREEFRDYYDIYCLINSGYKLEDAIDYASQLSRHTIRSKTMLSRLLSPQLFPKNPDFIKMKPKYDVSPEQIMERCKKAIIEENIGRKIQLTTAKL